MAHDVSRPVTVEPNLETLSSGGRVLSTALSTCVLVSLLSLLYWRIAADLAWQWWDDYNYSHGLLVPIFSGFLVWQRRRRLVGLRASGSWLGLLVLAAGVLALILGDLGAEQFLARASLVCVLAGLVLFHFGREIFRTLAFPMLFLFLMIPLPATVFYAIAFPLQSLAAQNAAWTLGVLGVPVLLDGNVIHLSQISLGVTEACSGIRSLVSLLVVGLAWGHITLPGFWSTAALLASTVPITIVANAGRVVVTGLVSQRFGVEYAQGVFHGFSGWIIFLVAFLCLLGIHAGIHLCLRRRSSRA